MLESEVDNPLQQAQSAFESDDPASPEAGVPAVRRFPKNILGRDFVVGDIHGMFPHLRSLLDQVGFDPRADRLFSVGDLVDRGPASAEAVVWLDYPWFHACRGNHEQFAIDSVDREELEFWVQFNGGEWWMDLSEDDQRAYREAFLRMPLAMEVETATGLVGIVHADVPPSLTWERFTEFLEIRHTEVLLYALFSRNRIHGAILPHGVRGAVDRVYCGHTPVRATTNVENVYFIDTAAVYSVEGYGAARLTMIEVQPERHQEYSLYTDATP